jgi:CTP:molybdopterin cytidylyltransferase MocA
MSAALVLAAGEGRRLGIPKALARIGDRSLVDLVVSTCRQSLVDEIIVVTGAAAEQVEAEVLATDRPDEGAPVRCVRNEGFASGRTGSLRVGWEAAGDTGALVFPVDHPAVRLQTLDAVLGVHGYAAGQAEVLVPVLLGPDDETRRRGHPIVLCSSIRAEVLALGADDPLNVFVRTRELLEVPVDDPGILVNVNLPADLERAQDLLR